MNIDDMILVSVDDHVIEPAHMFDGRRAGEVRGQGAPHRAPTTTAAMALAVRGPRCDQHCAERGRRTPAGGVGRNRAQLCRRDPRRLLRRRTSGSRT